jgi:glycosyltransferase involved in cell wall biosynthesis
MMQIKNRPIVICSNTAWNLWNFRQNLIRELVARGNDVIALAPADEFAPRLVEMGCRFVDMPMDNGGTDPGSDLALYWRFRRLFRAERPQVFLGYTVKPNVFGSLAAHAYGVKVINNIAGLGAVFIRRSLVTRIVEFLYRRALRRSAWVFFQNEDDRRQFIETGLVDPVKTECLPGSGIDLVAYPYVPPAPLEGRRFRFLIVARMLWDKGIGEYVEAANLLRPEFPNVDWCMLGAADVANPAAISRVQLDEWEASGVVRYLGIREDVREELVQADCVVLPSYREGTPRSLLEAAATGRPVVATNAVGCREVVDDGVNGLLCDVRSSASLADRMREILTMDNVQRESMGRAGRAKMEREFDVGLVVERYTEAIARIEVVSQ